LLPTCLLAFPPACLLPTYLPTPSACSCLLVAHLPAYPFCLLLPTNFYCLPAHKFLLQLLLLHLLQLLLQHLLQHLLQLLLQLLLLLVFCPSCFFFSSSSER
jgi:hypothetical protein